MPRRRFARRLRRRAKRTFARHTIKRRLRLSAGTVYRFKQTVSGAGIANFSFGGTPGAVDNLSQTVAGQAISMGFVANDLPQWTTFAALFDQYKITCVVLKFWPAASQATYNTSNPPAVQTFFANAIDYDDVNAPAGLNYILQYENAKKWPCLTSRTKPYKVVIRPHLAMSAFIASGSVASAYNTGSRWLDCAQNTVLHFGFKGWLEAQASANARTNFRVEATYYVSFKNVR